MFGHAGGHPFVKFDYQLNDMEVAILTNHSEHFRGTHSFHNVCARAEVLRQDPATRNGPGASPSDPS